MSIKHLLKAARRSLQAQDPEGTIDSCNEVLAEDKDNYYALVYKGKALSMLDDNAGAARSYRKATKTNANDPLAWKGLVAVSKTNTSNYKQFFDDVLGLAKSMEADQENLRPCVDIVRKYVNNAKTTDAFNSYYYRQIIPSMSELGELIGPMMGNPSGTLDRLISLEKKRENDQIRVEVNREKFHMPAKLSEKNHRHLDTIKFKYYSSSEIPQLYELLISMEMNDKRRASEEESLLRYKQEMLLAAPDDKKEVLYADVFNTVSDMVLVDTPSKVAYDTFFDWADPKEFGELELKSVTDYISKFGISGLGAILYALILSEISPYDIKDVKEYLKTEEEKKSEKQGGKKDGKKKRRRRKKKGSKEEEEEEEDTADGEVNEEKQEDGKEDNKEDDKEDGNEDKESDEDSKILLSPQEALDLMLAGIQVAKQSVLAHRIFVNFCIHLKEYQYALDYSQVYVRLTLEHSKKTGHVLQNTRLDSILGLAIIYTYHESPKNFPKAMSLYSSVLQQDPHNVQAKVGQGLIFMENENYVKAEASLRDVVRDYPDDFKACQEYGWCLVKLGKYQEGRTLIEKALQMITGTDASSLESKSISLWRIGQSYLDQMQTSQLDSLVKSAYTNFILSLKQSTNYPPCYTSLGTIFQKYYDQPQKALKCFYKAYDLDPSELVAAYELVKDFSQKCDWEMVQAICERVTANERARKLLLGDSISWPYRMLGCAAMERQDDAGAIEHYQSALRISPQDPESWIGLGEAYLGRGRLEASQKVFSHVIDLDPENWHGLYLLAVSQSSMLMFDESIDNLKKLFARGYDKEECVVTSLYETLLLRARYEVETGLILRSVDTVKETLQVIQKATTLDTTSQKLWRALADLLELCCTVQSHCSKIDLDTVKAIVDTVDLQSHHIPDVVEQVNEKQAEHKQGDVSDTCHEYLVQAAKNALAVLPVKCAKPLRAGLVYNLGVAYLSWFHDTGEPVLRDCAIIALRKAVQLETNNASFWCSLGIASLTRNGKVSQHCFIRASALAPRDLGVWVDLGVLYLFYGDYELANASFVRAQSLGPTDSSPWAGEALAADASGDDTLARRLYTHSYVLANGKRPLNSLLYGLSVVSRLVGSSVKEEDLDSVQEFSAAHFGLINYLKFYPNDKIALQIAATVAERMNSFDEGIKMCEELCKALEKADDVTSLAQAKSQLARMQLGDRRYDDCLESAESVSALLEDATELTETVQQSVLSSFAVTGLALYFQEDYERALEQFNQILETFPDSKRVVVMISQVLYAFDTDETKQAAVEELFKNIESYGSSMLVALTIAAISIVDDLQDYLPAVKEELLMVPVESRTSEIPFLVDQINKRMGVEDPTWQRSAFLFPADVKIWKNLDSKVALDVSVTSNKVDSALVGDSYVKMGKLREIQRGIFLSPSAEGFLALGGVV